MGFLLTFSVVYGLANIYIGTRYFHWVKAFLPISPIVYWVIFLVIAASPILSRVLSRMGITKAESFFLVGDWWLAVTYWSVMLWLLVDVIRLADKRLNFLPVIAKDITSQGTLILIILMAMLAYGSWNALHPVITRFDVTINKKVEGMKTLKIVLVSDIHMGRVVGTNRVDDLAKLINELNPDLVLYAGDVIDDDSTYVANNKIIEPLRNVRSRYGSYAVLGNHEYISGQPELAVSLLENAGIKVLRDQWTVVQDAMYIVGRDDMSAIRYGGHGTKQLATIMDGIDKVKPVLLMDHQPGRIHEAAQQGVDLQVAGHTHRGQFFPNNLITSKVYEDDWGYLQKGAYQLIVSCGYGTWGPPIRLGNKPEIVEINITFEG